MTAEEFEAICVIQQRLDISITDETKRELTELGMPTDGVPVAAAEDIRGRAVVVLCLTAVNGVARVRADNMTAPCAWGCGRTVQFRPHVPSDAQKVCAMCIAGRPEQTH